MLGCEKLAPFLAFQACGMFADIESAYAMSLPYIDKSENVKADINDPTNPTETAVEDIQGNNAP
jgi:hypothetical protein